MWKSEGTWCLSLDVEGMACWGVASGKGRDAPLWDSCQTLFAGTLHLIRDGHGLSHPQVCPHTKAQGPTGPTPGRAGGASVRKGHLRGGHEREVRVHWRQESSLCKGTEVWEGRVWCLGEQSE